MQTRSIPISNSQKIPKNLKGEGNKGKKVYVGMSGGVDSSVSAFLLKKAGYDVTGVFIKVWQPDNGECTWRDERRDAMRVAAALDIPFLTLDFSEEYKREVVDYMISEYSKGRTPNPDVMCNRYIKFGSFLSEALKNGIDFVATGHYTQNIFDPKDSKFHMREGLDKTKDQSYFLWTLEQKDLEHVLFPIGHLQKSEVRAIAEKNHLPVFDKKDSQGICFLGQVDMKEFLKEHIETKKGNVIDMDGNVIGEHDGALLYTIGERHGFRVFDHTIDEVPRYVVGKDMSANTITLAKETQFIEGEGLPSSSKIIDLNWISQTKPDPSIQYEARLRYRQKKQFCRIEKDGVIFDKPQIITPGQSVVFYNGEECMGGAILG